MAEAKGLTLTVSLEMKLRQEYETLLDQLYALCQLDVYSESENRFLFPEIHSQIYWYSQRLDEIARELTLLTGVKTRTLIDELL